MEGVDVSGSVLGPKFNIELSQFDGKWFADCQDYLKCTGWGTTPKEALEDIAGAIDRVLAVKA